MVAARPHHTMATIAQKPNTQVKPAAPYSQPPSAPPQMAPKNCELDYTPIAVPFLSGGVILAISDGRVASSRLKAMKNSRSPKMMPASECHSAISTSSDTASSAIAPSPSRAVSQKMPGTPIHLFNKGPAISATVKERPMLAPMVAMDFTREEH